MGSIFSSSSCSDTSKCSSSKPAKAPPAPYAGESFSSSNLTPLMRKKIRQAKKEKRTEVDAWVSVWSNPESLFEAYFEGVIDPTRISADILRELHENNPRKKNEEFDEETLRQEFISFIEESDHLTFKLVVTSIDPDIISKTYAKQKTEYGAVHMALQIGPYLIDWNDGCLCVPRVIRSARPIIALDLKTEINNSKETWMKIAKFITDWNNTMEYSPLIANAAEAQKESKGSCHAFVDSLMAVFGIHKWWEKAGPIDTYLQFVKDHCKPIRKFKEGIVFKNHQELDAYYEQHHSELDEEEKMLLKAFDRGFWMTDDAEVPANCPIVSGRTVFAYYRGGNKNIDLDSLPIVT